MLSTSWETLRQKCSFSESEFALFQDMLKTYMRNPENRVGLDGPWPITRRRAWEKWLDIFIDDCIGARWWGLGTSRKWSFPADRDKVRIFLSEVIQYVSGIVKQQLGAKKHQPLAARRSSVISEEGTFEGRTEDFENRTEPPTSATMTEPGQQGNVPTGRQLGPSRLGIGKPLDLIIKLQEAAQETRIPKRKPSIIRKEESKTRLRKGPLIIDIKPEPNESRTSTTKTPSTPCKLQHSYRRNSHSPESIISPILAPGSQNSPRPARFSVMGKRVLSQRVPVTGVSPGDAPAVAETRTTAPPGNSFRHIGTSPVTSTAPDPQIPLDFILETRLSLLSEIRLIYGTDFTSLSHLVDRIREKHRLKPEQEIVEIKVTIQGKVFDVDLQEPRDWRYVSEVIFENGSRAEMLVLTT